METNFFLNNVFTLESIISMKNFSFYKNYHVILLRMHSIGVVDEKPEDDQTNIFYSQNVLLNLILLEFVNFRYQLNIIC